MIIPEPHIKDDSQRGNGSHLIPRASRPQEHRISTEFLSEIIQLRDVRGIGASDHVGKVNSLATFVEILFVHKALLLASILISLAVGWIALMIWPRSYESEAKLILRVGRESVSLDPTATTSQTLLFQKTQEEEVNSALDIISSRRILERIVEDLGENPILVGKLASGTVGNQVKVRTWVDGMSSQASELFNKFLIASGIREPVSNHERAIHKLRQTTDVFAPKKSTAITIRAVAKSPEMAQAIAQSITDNFLEEHVGVSKTDGSHQFFVKQTEDTEKKLVEMLQRRSQLLQDRNMASTDAKHSILAAQLSTIESTLLSSQSALKQLEAEIDDLNDKASKEQSEIIATKQKQGDPTWSSMRTKLFELEMEEQRLATDYGPDHPKVQQARTQVAEAKRILATFDSNREDESKTPNPVKLRIEEDLQRKLTSKVGLQSMVAKTEAQKLETQKAIQELLNFEVQLSELNRSIESTETSLSMLREKEEEARVIDELQAQRISSIGIFQPATLSDRAFSPNKPLIALAFALFGLTGGVSWVLMRERSTDTFRTPQHVESNLDYPVIATIPYSRGRSRMQTLVRSNNSADIRVRCNTILSEILLSRVSTNHRGVRGKSIGVIGVADGCGASTVAIGLALASSEDAGLKTTLIDFDLTKRTVSGAFGLSGVPGFAELVSGAAGREDCTRHLEERSLNLMAGSATKSNRRIEAEPEVIVNALNELLDENDIVIVDLTPASRPDQTLSLAQILDHVIVVIESEKTDMVAARRLIRQLTLGNATIAGIVLNKSRNYLPGWLASLLR